MTHYNFEKLRELFYTYYHESFIILAFPCNQFGNQEPRTNDEIHDFIDSYNIRFPVFDKIDVNGEKEEKLYNYLKHNVKDKSTRINLNRQEIMWNFTKFLCVNGIPFHRYEPTISFKDIEKDIQKYLM